MDRVFKDVMSQVKGAYNALSPLLNDCPNTPPQGARVAACGGEDIMNSILIAILGRSKNPSDVISWYKGSPLVEERDINNLWTDLSAGLPVITNPDGSKQVTKSDGTIVKIIFPSDFVEGKLIISKNETTTEIISYKLDEDITTAPRAYTRNELKNNPNYLPATTNEIRRLTTQNVGQRDVWQRDIIAGNALELAFRDFRYTPRNGKNFDAIVRNKKVKPDFVRGVSIQEPGEPLPTSFIPYGEFTEVKVTQNSINKNSFNNQILGELNALSKETTKTGENPPKFATLLILVVAEGTIIDPDLTIEATKLGVSLFVSYAYINNNNDKVTFSLPESLTNAPGARLIQFPFNEVNFNWSEANRTWTQSNEFDEKD